MKKILTYLGLGALLLNAACKQAPKNYTMDIAVGANDSTPAVYTPAKVEEQKALKLEIKKVRGTARAYTANRLKAIKADKDEKSELEKTVKEQAKTLNEHLKEYKHDYAILIEYVDANGKKHTRGTTYELQLVGKVNLEDIAKLIVTGKNDKMHSKYGPLMILQKKFTQYEDGELLESKAYKLDLNKKTTRKQLYKLIKNKNGLIDVIGEITAEQIKKLTDGKMENGELTKAGVQMYIVKKVQKAQTQTKKDDKKTVDKKDDKDKEIEENKNKDKEGDGKPNDLE